MHELEVRRQSRFQAIETCDRFSVSFISTNQVFLKADLSVLQQFDELSCERWYLWSVFRHEGVGGGDDEDATSSDERGATHEKHERIL